MLRFLHLVIETAQLLTQKVEFYYPQFAAFFSLQL